MDTQMDRHTDGRTDGRKDSWTVDGLWYEKYIPLFF